MEADVIDCQKLRKLCFGGCPEGRDAGGVRQLCWKLLLNYLPPDRTQWTQCLLKHRQTYKDFIDEMIVKPGQTASGKTDVTHEDHPLNPNPNSEWNTYFKDNETLLQIDKDCRRLCPDMNFFQCATPYPCHTLVSDDGKFETLRKRVEYTVLDSYNVEKNRLGLTNMMDASKSKKKLPPEYATLSNGEEAHWEVIERMLFIYAKLNPGIKYVQGMNEVLGPLYYAFANDPDREWQECAEPDAFFCFTNLMAEIRDHFITVMDAAECGIGGSMSMLMEYLRLVDPQVSKVFMEQNLKPEFFAFRWLTLLLSQEFRLPDVLRLWDSLFADECRFTQHRFQFLVFACCAMIVLIRDQLIANDFASNMKMLQNYPATVGIEEVVQKGTEIQQQQQQR